ncbi:MAG: bifunctional UDP-N-acetylglucosamine diphosphorylase/glucosamine-1-phosphate N-acetyltransferase GlmU [Burkholderiales bacterium]
MKKNPLNVVILAAGKGTRMQSRLPKVLQPLGGRPLLGHVLARANEIHADRTIIVYGHGGHAVPNAYPDPSLTFVVQEPQLGTGHAVQMAQPHLLPGGSTLVLYGDVPLIQAQTLSALCAHSDCVTLLTCELDDPVGYGRIVRDAKGKVRRIVEENDASAAERSLREINTGVLCAPTGLLIGWLQKLRANNAKKEYYLTDIVEMAIRANVRVKTFQPGEPWEIHGVNSKDQLARIERVFQLQQAMALMRQGVTLADPWRFDLRGQLACGQDVFIDANCVFEGTVTLADDVAIGAGCVLRDVDIGPGSKIAPLTYMESAKIGAGCQVGPFARLRPGAHLADDVRIGNFVEIKGSQVGHGSKVNHLSYLGDATVGRNVNIGAGTITCNYDGVNKYRTIIEDEAFIGSDTMLVAPVTVGKGATIGAGSTITRNAPPDQLTLSRAPQTSIQGWKRPMKKPPAK